MAAPDSRTRGGALFEMQAEQGMKLLQAAQATGAEYDSAGAEAYRKEVKTRIAKLEMESTQLTGKTSWMRMVLKPARRAGRRYDSGHS